jgi:Ser-tRNA(Ala) deacylase AlaX
MTKSCKILVLFGLYLYFCAHISKTMEDYLLNDHNKEEFPPAHTAEHLLNQLMVRMFGCERSRNAHIERKKSKISYILDRKPDRKVEREIERQMNELIEEDLPVTFQFVTRAELEGIMMEAEEDSPESRLSLERLPEDASETIRLVRIGDYDVCPCIGKHVRSTAQIGRFEMLGTNWDEGTRSFRIRFKIVQ